MTVKHWIFLIWIIANALYYVTLVGKRRRPVTGGDAALSLIEWGTLAWLALS